MSNTPGDKGAQAARADDAMDDTCEDCGQDSRELNRYDNRGRPDPDGRCLCGPCARLRTPLPAGQRQCWECGAPISGDMCGACGTCQSGNWLLEA